MKTKQSLAVEHLLLNCGHLMTGERLLILCDDSTDDIACCFEEEARLHTQQVKRVVIPCSGEHGKEPAAWVLESMINSDLILSLCKFSLAHSEARIIANQHGSRFLSLPLYTWSLLEDPALLVDYKAQAPIVRAVADAFTNGSKIRVCTEAGTDITLDIRDRVGNFCPGFVQESGDLGSPPDIEANVSPQEEGSYGTVIVDGSITCPELGLLSSTVKLDIQKGRIQSFESDNKAYTKILDRMFEGPDSKRRVLAECGVGLNPKAKLTGTMLTDEGALGCVHFGFGSNYTVGGKNKVDFHLDFVFRQPSLRVDEKDILVNGDLVI